ncbi:MAG: HK97 family phage prohead protease, partial [Xanthobacteraceae bacterium]
LLRAGAVDGLSIGFRTARSRVDPARRVRKLIDVELWEISIVTFPLLAGARVRSVKDLASGRDERLFRRHPRLSFTRARAAKEWSRVAS